MVICIKNLTVRSIRIKKNK